MARKNGRQKRKCEHKKKYESKEAAHQTVIMLWQKKQVVKPYRCPFCHAWHVGHSRNGLVKEKIIQGFKIGD